jgi:GNAT superfamily N-acetyltransferase
LCRSDPGTIGEFGWLGGCNQCGIMQLGGDYREEVMLDDGTRVTLRLVRPDDKVRLVEILDGLSAHSRTMRFFVARLAMSEKELRYLTEIDGIDHFAVLAMRGDESIGVARFIRHADAPGSAEPALTIVDEMQRRGLGRILFQRLIDAARDRGISQFKGEVLPQNKAMLGLLRGVAAKIPPRRAPAAWSESVTFFVDLDDAAAALAPAPLAPLAPLQRFVA